MLYSVLQRIPVEQVALHCHDSYGQALANILAGLEVSHRHGGSPQPLADCLALYVYHSPVDQP